VQPGKMYGALLEGGWFPPLVVTVRKTCLDRVGLFDETLRGHDDWDLWLRIARDGVFQGIPDILARYRVHDAGLSANADHMLEDQLRATAKHFGPFEGNPAAWAAEKRRAYGFALRSCSRDFFVQGRMNDGWSLFAQAVDLSPDLLYRLDTFYELVCGGQLRGYRGQAQLLDIERSGAEVLQRLDTLFAAADAPARARRDGAYGNAYLALAMLSDQAGDWAAARRYLRRAIRSHPALLCNRSMARRLLKLSLGPRVVATLRQLQFGAASKVTG